MAVGNTFGATALSSYGGFWIGTAIILTPGGFEIISSLEETSNAAWLNSFGLYLMVRAVRNVHTDFDDRRVLTRFPGLVHLHLPPPDLHSQIHGRVLPALLHT